MLNYNNNFNDNSKTYFYCKYITLLLMQSKFTLMYSLKIKQKKNVSENHEEIRRKENKQKYK